MDNMMDMLNEALEEYARERIQIEERDDSAEIEEKSKRIPKSSARRIQGAADYITFLKEYFHQRHNTTISRPNMYPKTHFQTGDPPL